MEIGFNSKVSLSDKPELRRSLEALRGRQRFSSLSNKENYGMPEDTEISPEKCRVVDWRTDPSLAVQLAKRVLHSDGLAAVPTDTVYGITCLAQSSSAVDKIYQVKQRDSAKPIAICVGDIAELHKWAHSTVPDELLAELLPGPVTLVFKRKLYLNPELNPDTDLIGVRIPDCWFIQKLAKECGGPIALTSANRSGAQSSLSVQEFSDLWPVLDVVVDGGFLGPSEDNVDLARMGSTVVDLSQRGSFFIIRPGSALHSTVRVMKKFDLKEVDQFSR